MKVAIHVEAHDAEVVGPGNVRDDALSSLALFGHAHPHVPIPKLGGNNQKVTRFLAGRALQLSPLLLYLFWRRPLRLQLVLVQGLSEHPAQPRHGLHSV